MIYTTLDFQSTLEISLKWWKVDFTAPQFNNTIYPANSKLLGIDLERGGLYSLSPIVSYWYHVFPAVLLEFGFLK